MAREDDPDDDDEVEPRRPKKSHRRRAAHPAPSHAVRRWEGDADEEEDAEIELETEEKPGARRRGRWISREEHPVYWRARDSLYFEPLVAVAIIVVLLAGLYAYTQNWPPVYVVESDSMQHGDTDILGLINTGDLVLAQKIPLDQITPYVVGMQTGYSTYGEYGDVVLYYPNGADTTPIIHRAILWLGWNPADDAYNATDLSGLPCGLAKNAAYNTSAPPSECSDLTDLKGTLTLYHIGWRSATVTLDLSSSILGAHSGFVTMGDNNYNTPCTPGVNCVGLPDQNIGRSTLVAPTWIVGVARGMLPWFGALKLLLEGNAGYVPPQSWQFLGLTIAGLILLAFGIHYALRAEGVEDPRRRAEEEAEDEEADEEPARPPGRARRFLHGLRPWGRDEEDDEPDATPRVRSRPKPSTGARRTSHRGGRPRPRVQRAKKHRPPADDSDEDL
jgi:signal peptidase I